jgi:hypothetical protein
MAEYEIPVLKISTGQMTPTAIQARVAQVDTIIDAHLAAMILGSSSYNIVEYELHTGQTKTRVEKSSQSDIATSLEKLQKYRDYLAAKCVPRNVRLVGINSFRNNY